jgi:hypothetical protein
MKTRAITLAAVLAAVFALPPVRAGAQTETTVAAAAAGIYPPSASYGGIPLGGLTFGTGVTIATDGSASGDFHTKLLGTSVLGQPQEINVDGNATSGSVPAAGTARFSGNASVDMGDGTPPIPAVPYTVTLVVDANGRGTLTLVLGTTNLPAATVNEGSMMIQ